MKINSSTRFPFPVLSDQTNDYLKGKFSLDLVVEEAPTSGKLKIEYKLDLVEDELVNAVQVDKARIGLIVHCGDTYYYDIEFLKGFRGCVEFPAGKLKGKASIRPFVCAAREIAGYKNKNLHPEFSNFDWNFTKGNLLAFGQELIINVGREKLAPMESIFTLAVNNELKEDEIRVQPENETIQILCSETTSIIIQGLRNTHHGRTILLNSIYLPAIMEVLYHLKENPERFIDLKWYKVFSAKCEHLGIKTEDANLLQNAQSLLKFPISKLKKVAEEWQ